MLAFLGGIAVAAAAAAAPSAPSAIDPCAGDPSCRQLTAAELFAEAEAKAAQGDIVAAEDFLEALTGDPDPEIRAEARFRLAGLRERRGDLDGAVAALRDLLAEKPDAQRARLELGRLLAVQGDARAARRELQQAEAAGLPTDVAQTVRRFSTALNPVRRRGATIDLVSGRDSNVNRATSAEYVDTVIAPFELDPDAREQSGVGLGIGGEAWSRNDLLGTTWLTRVGAYGDLFFGKSRFNDVQLSLTSGPELAASFGRLRPALVHERRWYGGDSYSVGYGGSVNWLTDLNPASQFQVDASVVRQSIRNNAFLDGWRYALTAAYDRRLNSETFGRVVARGTALDAEVLPESLRQFGGDTLLAHQFGFATVFASAGYTRTRARAPVPLFGRTRSDHRFDLGAGIILNVLEVGGFSPLARITYTNSSSNLELYDYRRARLDFGFTREF
jgi:tetratricopeptide (TPR) repeat protein